MSSRWQEFGVLYPDIYDYIVAQAKNDDNSANYLKALIELVNIPIPVVGVENIYTVEKHGYIFLGDRRVGQIDDSAQYVANLLNTEMAALRVQLIAAKTTAALLVTVQKRIIELESQVAKMSNDVSNRLDDTLPLP